METARDDNARAIVGTLTRASIVASTISTEPSVSIISYDRKNIPRYIAVASSFENR